MKHKILSNQDFFHIYRICIIKCSGDHMQLFTKLTMIILFSYCVMNGNDFRVVEGEQIHEIQSVASISKVMTAYIAIEEGNLKDTWHVGSEIKEAYGSMIYLEEGQVVSLESLLHGLMLRSGNDAAIAIATHISGSEKAFVTKMNQKAKELGMTHTLFHNASGLDEEDGGNLSCAYDMALLMNHAMKNETFARIAGTKYYKSEWGSVWKNKNKLLFEDNMIIAGKTGYTENAGRTLVTSSAYQEILTSVVTLNESDDFNFHAHKHQKAYQNTNLYTLLAKGTYVIEGRSYHVKEDIVLSYDKNKPLDYQIYTSMKDEWVIEVVLDDQRFIYKIACEGYQHE